MNKKKILNIEKIKLVVFTLSGALLGFLIGTQFSIQINSAIELLIIIIITILSSLFTYFFASYKKRNMIAMELRKSKEQGYSQGFHGSIKVLVKETKTLNIIQHWLYKQRMSQTSSTEIQEAVSLFERLFEDLKYTTGLNYIPIGTILRFDPRSHKSYEKIDVGMKVIVVEPGWLIGNEIIQKPTVRRYK